MTNKKLKQKIFSLVPLSHKKRVKNFYYNNLIFPLYNLKYEFFYGFWDFFDSIALETTTHCNLRCKFCPNSKHKRGLFKNKNLMSRKLFNKIINELSKINYQGTILLHFYGEPLTDKRLPILVKQIKKKLPKSFVQVNTNGFLLTIPLYKELLGSGVDKFFITQYSQTMPQKVKELFEYVCKRPKKENKISYRVLGKDLGLSNRGGEINVKNCIDFERPICTYPNTAVHVNYAGKIVLCCNDYHSSVVFGDLNKESLLDIWNKPGYKKLRKEIKKGIFKLPICKKCVGIQ